jgi:hypothetical protein
LTPSPTIAARFPARRSSSILAAFSHGETFEKPVPIPSSAATNRLHASVAGHHGDFPTGVGAAIGTASWDSCRTRSATTKTASAVLSTRYIAAWPRLPAARRLTQSSGTTMLSAGFLDLKV